MELVVTKSKVYDHDPSVVTTILLYQRISDNILRKALEAKGYKIITPSMNEVSEVVACLNYDLAILDFFQAPGDFTLLNILKHADLNKPSIMLTKYGHSEYQLAALEIGCDNYIVKPIHIPAFIQYMENLLKRCTNFEKVAAGNPDSINGVQLYIEDACLVYNESDNDQIIVPLAPVELIVMKLLYEYHNYKRGLLPKSVILKKVAFNQTDKYRNGRSLDVRIRGLREKLKMIPLSIISKKENLVFGYKLQLL